MVAFPALPEISDEESEWLESIFNSEYHGEMRIERDDLAKRFTINWFDSCISAQSILELKTRAEKDWASTFTRLHDEYLKNNEKVKLIEALELDNQHLKDQLALLKDDMYGTSSEQSILPKVDIEEPNPPTNLVTPDFTIQDKAQRSELGLVLRTGKLMIFDQLERKFNETYSPSYIYRRIQERSHLLSAIRRPNHGRSRQEVGCCAQIT